MAGKPPKDDGGGNTEAFIAVLLLFIALVCYCVWTFARAYIVLPALALDYVYILGVEWTIGIGDVGRQYKQYIANFFNGTYSASTDMTWGYFVNVRTVVGNQVRWVLGAATMAMGVIVLMKMKGKGFTRTFNLQENIQLRADKSAQKKMKKEDIAKLNQPSFGKYQAEQWKVATYSSQFDPDGFDKDVRPSATPLEWLQQNGISWENGRFDDEAKAKLVDAFRAQLGQPWHGFARASLYTQAILILCALHYLGSIERFLKYAKIAIAERETLNIAWAGKNNGEEAMVQFVEKYKNTKEITKLIDHFCKENGFEHTAIYNFLMIARKKSGILKDADMGYIKRFNRSMWYTLNNCGRHAFHIEAAGVVNHYKAERVNRSALREGRINEAIVGLEAYLNAQGIYSLSEFFSNDDIFEDV
jgi:hypothetical protein